MNLRWMHFVLLVVVGALVGTQFSAGQVARAVEHADAFMLYPHASRVWSGKVEGWDELTYHVEVKFPGSSVIGWIAYKLQEEGWEPLTHDFLNPELSSSQVKGWTEILEGPRIPGDCVHLWIGDWKDPSGDIVRYALRYRQGKRCTSDATDLEVNATYLPSAVAEQQQHLLDYYKKQSEHH